MHELLVFIDCEKIVNYSIPNIVSSLFEEEEGKGERCSESLCVCLSEYDEYEQEDCKCKCE